MFAVSAHRTECPGELQDRNVGRFEERGNKFSKNATESTQEEI